MNEFIWIVVGIISALVIAFIIYITQVCVKIWIHKNKIKNTLIQINSQVDIKHNLLKEYININQDTIIETVYDAINIKLNDYDSYKTKDIDVLKDFNDSYVYYMKSFDDSLLSKQCDESEEKISYIKEYYNELVCFYNRYKANGINNILSRALSINDEKLY